MSIPVLIPARNESRHIGETLEALSRQTENTEPIVVVNGNTDSTPDIARNMGALVLESSEGKMPALQVGMRHLGKRVLESLLILDADSKPLFKGWASRLSTNLASLPKEDPAIVWGPYFFHGEINLVVGAFYTATSVQVSWVDRDKAKPRTVRGGNIGLKINNEDLFEELLGLENYWPREDVAIFDTAVKHDANKKVVFHPEAWVQTSGYRSADILKKVIRERRHPSKITDDSYAREAPLGSKPYFSKD